MRTAAIPPAGVETAGKPPIGTAGPMTLVRGVIVGPTAAGTVCVSAEQNDAALGGGVSKARAVGRVAARLDLRQSDPRRPW